MDDVEIKRGLMEQGFLSHVVDAFPDTYRKMMPAWFDVAEEFSRVGQRVVIRAMNQGHGDNTDPRVLGTLLLLRTLQSYQTAIIAASRSLATESRTLIRGCFENAFCIAALHRDPAGFRQALIDDDKASKKARAKFIAKDPKRMVHLTEEQRGDFGKFASTVDSEWGKVKLLAIDEIAAATELADAYLLYRVLAADSAHPSLESLQDHIVQTPGGWDYRLGPAEGERVTDTLNYACHAIMATLVAFTQFIGDRQGNQELINVAEAYTKLAYGSRPAAVSAGSQ